jgi:hypothetical protein
MSGAAKRLLQLQLTRAAADANGETDGLEATLLAAAQSAPIRVRVGVHGGMANVGNMGCVQRLSYTALGDAVNTASRLEGFVKRMQGPCDVVCGAAVLDDAHPALLARYIGPVRLVGKREPIRVCQVIDAAHLGVDEVVALRERSGTGALAHRDCDCPEADAAVASYLHGGRSALDARALYLLGNFNDAVQRLHDAFLRGVVCSPTPLRGPVAATAFATRGDARTSELGQISIRDAESLVGAAAANNDAVRRELVLLQSAYADLAPKLRAAFALEDSLQCVRSGTGAVECESK